MAGGEAFRVLSEAVKVIDLHRFCLHPSYDKLRRQIMREMSLLQRLEHRNIVKLVDFYERLGRRFRARGGGFLMFSASFGAFS